MGPSSTHTRFNIRLSRACTYSCNGLSGSESEPIHQGVEQELVYKKAMWLTSDFELTTAIDSIYTDRLDRVDKVRIKEALAPPDETRLVPRKK
jgi:hypothetical protein